MDVGAERLLTARMRRGRTWMTRSCRGQDCSAFSRLCPRARLNFHSSEVAEARRGTALGRAEAMLTLLKRVEGGCHRLCLFERGSHRFCRQFRRPDGSSGGAERSGGQRQRPSPFAIIIHSSSSFIVFCFHFSCCVIVPPWFHVARREVQVARISSFNLKLF